MYLKMIFLIIILSGVVNSQCVHYDSLKRIINLIHIGLSEKQVNEIIDKYNCEPVDIGKRGLKLSNYDKKINEKGDTVLVYRSPDLKTLAYRINNCNTGYTINFEVNPKDNKIVNKYILKEGITEDEFSNCFGILPTFNDSTLVLIEKEYKKGIHKKGNCNRQEIMGFESNETLIALSIDTMIKIIEKEKNGNDLACIAAKYGWFWNGSKKNYDTTFNSTNLCGDTILVNLPLHKLYFTSKADLKNKITVIFIRIYGLNWIVKVLKEPIMSIPRKNFLKKAG